MKSITVHKLSQLFQVALFITLFETSLWHFVLAFNELNLVIQVVLLFKVLLRLNSLDRGLKQKALIDLVDLFG